MTIQLVAAALLLLAALYTDLKSMTIPNLLTVPFLAGGWLYALFAGGGHGLVLAIGGAAAGFVPLLILHLAKGIGAGDVKLFAALGAWVGAMAVLQLMMYAILYAGLVGLVLLFINRPFSRRMMAGITAFISMRYGTWSGASSWLAWAKSGRTFPFMLAVLPGAVTLWMISV
ncbi:prepilin peptidase CpaA [Paenibacillus catalpae]|uniref:Prepilin peptidase CpaA n=1 Tax=Paenibacillus catalpae TaxID=1045775 RepID=A0A1I2AEW6_9BACL|nr:prepilin peptidase [Paenibacillus catalpae]SFE42511.1 prepilin peptidase CpaA [Paenibacillus catalpae]